MELKTKYQYTYFIHPYIVKENKFVKYLMKLLKDPNCNLRVFQKDKDLSLYTYFSHRIRNYMFSSFNISKNKIEKLKELPLETQAALLAKNPCTIFEYNIKKDIQGKTEEKSGIFFKIQKLEIICFNTGICFLTIKTNIEDSNLFTDVLNFNYKFRDINQEFGVLSNYDRIRVQTDSYSDVKVFKDFIREITGSRIDAMKLDIDTERFLTYSYVCIEQDAWNVENEFDKIKDSFIKFMNVLPNDNSVKYDKENIKAISRWKYAKLGLVKQGITLFSSSCDINNYTVFPQEFEQQYLYTYILALFIKIYLKKINLEFRQGDKIKRTRKEFIKFTKTIWINEITSDDTGSILFHNLKEVLEINELYFDTKNKFDILYKELNIEKNAEANLLIIALLLTTLVVNVINFLK